MDRVRGKISASLRARSGSAVADHQHRPPPRPLLPRFQQQLQRGAVMVVPFGRSLAQAYLSTTAFRAHPGTPLHLLTAVRRVSAPVIDARQWVAKVVLSASTSAPRYRRIDTSIADWSTSTSSTSTFGFAEHQHDPRHGAGTGERCPLEAPRTRPWRLCACRTRRPSTSLRLADWPRHGGLRLTVPRQPPSTLAAFESLHRTSAAAIAGLTVDPAWSQTSTMNLARRVR